MAHGRARENFVVLLVRARMAGVISEQLAVRWREGWPYYSQPVRNHIRNTLKHVLEKS